MVLLDGGPILPSSFNLSYLPKTLSPDIVTFGMRALYEYINL